MHWPGETKRKNGKGEVIQHTRLLCPATDFEQDPFGAFDIDVA